jgi:membrane protein required for colicin V production
VTGLDWLIVGILVVSVLLATAHGFFYELFVLAGSVLGYLLAAWNYKRLGAWLLSYAKNEWIAQGAAFLAIFVCVLFLAGAAGRVARWAAQGVGLRWFDRLLGAAFGVVRGALIVMVMVMAMAAFGSGSRLLAESRLGSYFLLMGRGASWVAPTELRARFRDGLHRLSDLRNEESQQTAGNSGTQK